MLLSKSATFRGDTLLLAARDCDKGRKYLSTERGTPIRSPSATPYNDNCTGDRAIASTAVIIFNAGN
ncbi:hypothetical protein [Microcoleus vaginatus]|uniref:hypothetical protein n=1 Tax=Microcoleus vaginatus TaxID=119532 RepID=UPI001305449B